MTYRQDGSQKQKHTGVKSEGTFYVMLQDEAQGTANSPI